MDEEQEIERLRDNWHDLRESTAATGITVAVIQERQTGIARQMDRIETAVSECNALLRQQNSRIAKLETRAEDAAHVAAKWGGWIGGAVAALIGGLVTWFGGGK